MLTETLSGKCPCCNYPKLIQRYGSQFYLQLDGCANCGFGYATNHHDFFDSGVAAWLPYAKHLLSLDGHELSTLNSIPDEEARKLVFDWCEGQDRVDDVDTTIFVYTEEDIINHRALGLPILNADVSK